MFWPWTRSRLLSSDFHQGISAGNPIIRPPTHSHLRDFIEDKKRLSVTDEVIQRNLAEQTRSVLGTLTPREEKVLKMRFGIGERSNHTLEEVGQDFDVTRERIRQIEAKALRKLRHPSRSRVLKTFLDN